jgi:hypothetical protein
MDLQKRVASDMKRRVAFLPDEVNDWHGKASRNVDGLGIHRSQFEQLKRMMDKRFETQTALLDQFSPALPVLNFSQNYEKLTLQIVGLNNLWSFFRAIMDQHQNPDLKPLLMSADLIAADCYLTCMNRAVQWGRLTESQFREPPLVYLEASDSPVTASRGREIKLLSSRIVFSDQALPIPVVRLPSDHVRCLWLFCSLHHEVGHNVDQDLKLRDELSEQLAVRLGGEGVPPERITVWQQWTSEILADVFGVLLAGAGFGYTMGLLLLPIAPLFPSLMHGRPHPDSWVRMSLIGEMLRACGAPQLAEAADFISQQWYEPRVPRPGWIKPYVEDCKMVADFFLNHKLQALSARGASHSLREFVPDPDLRENAKSAARLARWLVSAVKDPAGIGFNRPEPNDANDGPFPWRLVPVGTQLAYIQLDATDPQAFERLQTLALQFLTEIEQPEFLATPVDRNAHLDALTENIDFGALLEGDQE